MQPSLEEQGQTWLEEQFECENCSECGQGAEGHIAIPLYFGHYWGHKIIWFARCKEIQVQVSEYVSE